MMIDIAQVIGMEPTLSPSFGVPASANSLE